jgi:hypothetical protein
MSTIAQAAGILQREFASLIFARSEFPMLTDWGVEDFSETIHSLGMNYLASLGRQHGRWAVSEYPVPVLGEPDTSHVRLDAVWWTRPAGQLELLAEFERYESGAAKWSIVQEKARHLLLSHYHLPPGPRLLLLVLWALSGRVPSRFDELRELARLGYRTSGNTRVPGVDPESRFMVATAVFAEVEGKLHLREVLL